MSDLAARMKQVWETTSTRNAHLGLDGEEPMLMARYRELVSSRIRVGGKVVIDFGMGGALLGRHLMTLDPESRRPRLYVGYDIAERSIAQARRNLDGIDGVKLIQIKRHVWSFADEHPDVIVCLACIIHFPTKIYLDNVLHEIDRSGARRLVLEIRNPGMGTVFQLAPYSTSRKTLLACTTTPEYVAARLPSYELGEKTTPAAPTHLQVLWLRRRDA